jgi:hypothetical protein
MEVDKENFQIDSEQLQRLFKAVQGFENVATNKTVDAFNYADPLQSSSFKLIEVTEEIATHVLEGKE